MKHYHTARLVAVSIFFMLCCPDPTGAVQHCQSERQSCHGNQQATISCCCTSTEAVQSLPVQLSQAIAPSSTLIQTRSFTQPTVYKQAINPTVLTWQSICHSIKLNC